MDSGSGDAEPEVVYFLGACHKRFGTLGHAEAFIADWEEKCASVIKAKVEEELSNGCRPAKMQETPVGLNLKTEGGGGEDYNELIESLSAPSKPGFLIVWPAYLLIFFLLGTSQATVEPGIICSNASIFTEG
jgi:hypothetical protein